MKPYILSVTAIAASIAIASPASAQLFAGGSQGCFAVSPSTSCAVSTTSTDNGLTYTGGPATFAQSTDATGFAAIGGPTNNFGTITLAPSMHSYGGDMFDLLVNFTAPPGSGSGAFTANLVGSLVSFGTGGVQINFTNPTQILSDGSGGSFTLHVNDVSFSGSPSGTDLVLRQNISGYIQAVPEPATWAMMLLGFGAIGFSMRTRRRPIAQIA